MNNKEKMLNLMEVDDHAKAVEAVLRSGLLPEPQLQQWLNQMVERAIRRSLGKSGCPEWETWAAKWLSGEDQTAWAARIAEVVVGATARAASAAAEAAEAAAWAARAAVEAARAAARTAWDDERKAQYDDLLNLIKQLDDKF